LPEDCPRALKAIVAKSLASDIGRRYNSAQAFESDLHAFLKGQSTAAEADREPAWDANATVIKESARAAAAATKPAVKPPVAVPVPKKHRSWNEWSNVAIALLAGILAGVLILIPASYCYRFWTSAAKLRLTKDYAHQAPQIINADWTTYQQLRTTGGVLRHLVPVADLDAVMHDHLVNAADNILDQYRGSTDAQLRDFDWAKAKLCLQKALEIDPEDVKAKSKLALVMGYTMLARGTSPASGNASLKYFRTAASYMPHSPDPHVGMARVYVSCFHNIGQALGELHLAEQFGYKLGPREMEEEADGYLFRAEAELTKARHSTNDRPKWLTMARDDMDRARELYVPIAGFANVSSALEQLDEDQQTQVQLETASLHLITPKKRWKVYR
jgi:tetratricopeptide (TPR) repeat protein